MAPTDNYKKGRMHDKSATCIRLLGSRFFLSFQCFFFVVVAVASQPLSNLQLPKEINLRVGLFLAPPFAFIADDETIEVGNNESSSSSSLHPFSTRYQGFEIDMLESFKDYATQDDITLNIDLGVAPKLYNAALDLVANDCNTTVNPNLLEDCEAYDIIVGDYYQNVDRFLRVDFTPSWLHSSLGVLKYLEQEEGSSTTTNTIKSLSDAEKHGAKICYPPATFIETILQEYMSKRANLVPCPTPTSEGCIQFVKDGGCTLLADDNLILEYLSKNDPTLHVISENIQPQYFVWPMKQSLHPVVSWLIKKWTYQAGSTGDLERIYRKYFKAKTCPVGRAGTNCSLPCDAEHGIADVSGNCICISTKWTGDDCSTQVEENLNLPPTSLVYISYILVGITFTAVVFCLGWLIYSRHRAQVKAAQPTFLVLVAIGAVISTSTIIALAKEEGSCMAAPWLYCVGFCITVGSLFARIWRVYELVRSAVEMRRVKVSTRDTIAWVCFVLVVDVAILVVWTVVDPLEWTRETISADKFGEPLESIGYCRSDHWVIFVSLIATFHLTVMAVACFMCYKARHIPEEFSGGKYVAIAMFSNLQIFIVAVPALFVVRLDPESSFFVRAICVWLNDIVVIVLIFVTDCIVWRGDRREIKLILLWLMQPIKLSYWKV